MKSALASLLLILIPLSVVARDSGYTVKYDGGTLPDTKAGSDLKMYVEGNQVRFAKGKKDVAIIPASAIAEISYGQDVHRRVRTAVAIGILSLGVEPLSTLVKSKKHFVGLTWADGDKKGGLAVQCDKNEYRGILAGLEGVSGKRAVNTDVQQSNESKTTVQSGEAVHETTAMVNKQTAAPAPGAETKPEATTKQAQPRQVGTTSDAPNMAHEQAGVSEKVITAMVNKQTAAPASGAETKPETATKQVQPSQAGITSDATNMTQKQGEAGNEKFSDVTTVASRTHSWPLGKGLLGAGALNFQYECPEQAASCQPSKIDVTFTRYGRDWILMHAPKEIIFSVDGERIRANDVKWEGLTTSDGVEEFFTGTVSAEEFRLFLAARDAEMEVGGTSGFTKVFTPKDLDDWRAFGQVVSKAK